MGLFIERGERAPSPQPRTRVQARPLRAIRELLATCTYGTMVRMPHSRERLWLVLWSLLISLFLSALDSTIVATALPTIVGELGGLDHIAWVFTSYLLT